jgi:hypothetical protein
MRAWRLETSVPQNGIIQVDNLPFRAGEEVEVIVLERSKEPESQDWQLLKGSVVRYDDPTSPVGVEDWDALK